MCMEVDRALYVMRDLPALWYKEFARTLIKMRLVTYKEEPSLFIDPKHKVFVLFFVDDIQILYL